MTRQRSPAIGDVAPTLSDGGSLRLTTSLQRWHHRFQAGEWIAGQVPSLPQPEQPVLASDGVVSVCAVPVFAGVNLAGYLRLDDCRDPRDWPSDAIAGIIEFADCFGSWLANQNESIGVINF